MTDVECVCCGEIFDDAGCVDVGLMLCDDCYFDACDEEDLRGGEA